jgi:hypothetical protein
MCWLLALHFPRAFLQRPQTVLTKETRQAICKMSLVSTCNLSLYFSLDIYIFYSSSEQSQGKNKQRIEDISTDHTTRGISTTITPLVCNYCKQFNIYSIKNILIKDMKILPVRVSQLRNEAEYAST